MLQVSLLRPGRPRAHMVILLWRLARIPAPLALNAWRAIGFSPAGSKDEPNEPERIDRNRSRINSKKNDVHRRGDAGDRARHVWIGSRDSSAGGCGCSWRFCGWIPALRLRFGLRQ